jgi:LPS export ABC transporter protein LptC
LSLKNDMVIVMIGIGLVLFQTMFVIKCGQGEKDAVAVKKDQGKFPTQEGWNSELYISKAGRPQAIVHYGHMTKYETPKVVYFDEGVEVDFYDEAGNHTSNLTSERGEYYEKTEDVVGIGNVVVVSDSGVTLMTEVIKWDNSRGKIFSDTMVTIITEEQDTLYGKGLESDPNLGHWVILKPWGISQRRIKIENIEESFQKPDTSDKVCMDTTGRKKEE